MRKLGRHVITMTIGMKGFAKEKENKQSKEMDCVTKQNNFSNSWRGGGGGGGRGGEEEFECHLFVQIHLPFRATKESRKEGENDRLAF